MSFREFIDYWRNVQNIDYEYDKHDMKVLYLKDWHFVKQFPEYIAYETPVYFESDWINEYYTKKPELEDDYRFVYMGPKQSWYCLLLQLKLLVLVLTVCPLVGHRCTRTSSDRTVGRPTCAALKSGSLFLRATMTISKLLITTKCLTISMSCLTSRLNSNN